jgi:CO/xanthine dehydrogenase FAD-binding subunit
MATTHLVTPSTVAELAEALAGGTARTRLVAGGTDLMRTLRLPGGQPDTLIDLSGLSELSYVHRDGHLLRIGALTTFTELQYDPLVRAHALCLALAAAQVGSVQIRNVATLGGNVANASPCADGVTALVALDAVVKSIDGGGVERSRPIEEVVLGPAQTSLAPDEAIVEFSFAALGPEYRTSFAKIGSRTAVSVARLSAGLVVRLDAVADVIAETRVALGAVGGTAFRARALERELIGRRADGGAARLLADGCVAAVQASIPGRHSLPYKQHAAVGLAYDAWNGLALGPPCEPLCG